MQALIHRVETPVNIIESSVYSDFEAIEPLVRHLDTFRDQLDSLVCFILQHFQPAQTRVDPIEARVNARESRVHGSQTNGNDFSQRVKLLLNSS